MVGAAVVDGDTDLLLALAAAVESDSEHPLARAIVTAPRGASPFRPLLASGR